MARIAQSANAIVPVEWPAHVRRASGRTPAGAAPRRADARTLAEQRGRHIRGALSELAAAALLLLKGYRIVERRHRSRAGEIDLIAVRGRRLAFVEVKFRRTIRQATDAITGIQERRIGNAAEQWVWQHPRYHGHEIGLDAILVAPGRLPRHVINALQPHG
jgi:putative endonuclease